MSNSYLALTAISSIWDTKGELFLLGPWCLNPKNRELLADKKFTMVHPPNFGRGDLVQRNEYCNEVYENILPYLSGALNRIHKKQHSIKYWRILAGPWLLHYVQIMYERYTRILLAIKECPGAYTHEPSITDFSTKDTYDFVIQAREDFFNQLIFSIIAKQKGMLVKSIDCLDHIALESNTVLRESHPSSKSRSKYIVKYISSLISQALINRSSVNLIAMYHLGIVDYLMLTMMSNYNLLGGKYCIEAGTPHISYNSDMRENLYFDIEGDEFKQLIASYLPQMIPCSLVEGYSYFSRKAERMNPKKTRIVVSAVGWNFEELFKYYAASCAESGSKLFAVQHGGYYGQSLAHIGQYDIIEHDCFYTWGWHEQGSLRKKTKVLPSPHLSRIINSHKPKGKHILFITNEAARYWRPADNIPGPEITAQHLDDQLHFLEQLSPEIRKYIYYRPSFYDYGWGISDKIREAFPEISMATKGRATEWMQSAVLNIIDHPGTSMLEVLSVNAPTILFWKREYWPMRSVAEKYFDYFHDVGVLYYTPESAATKLYEIVYNPKGWWFLPEIQEVRRKFLERYGYACKNWRKIWAQEIRQMKDEI